VLGAEDRAQQSPAQTKVGDGVEEAPEADHQNDHFSPGRERIDQFDRRRQSGPRALPRMRPLGWHRKIMRDRYGDINSQPRV
jgi:hypothetical protein